MITDLLHKQLRPKSSLVPYFWEFKPTRLGRYYTIALIAACGMGSASLVIPLYHLATTMGALFLLILIVGRLLRPKLTIQGTLPAKASAGQPLTGRLQLHNPSRRSAYDVSIGMFHLPPELDALDEGPLVPHLPPGQSVPISLRLQPHKRGLYPLEKVVPFSTFPFNLFRTKAGAPVAGSLMVLPSFHSLEGVDLSVGSRYQPGGVALTSHIGESPEYIGNREYRPGDPTRRIDFRSWARLAKPVVKEFQEEFYCRIALVLDTYVAKKQRRTQEGNPQLESAISLTAATADALCRGEYLIDLFAAGPNLYVFRAGRHRAHFDSVLEILACVDPCRKDPFDSITPALSEELQSISSVVCVFLDWDKRREKIARAAVEAGCAVKIVIVRSGSTTLPLAEAEQWASSVRCFTPEQVQRGEIGSL